MADMNTIGLHVFVSYPGVDGKPLALLAKDILDESGYTTWVYTHDRTLGALVWEEISDIILNKCDLFLYICTMSSNNSRGQMFESEYAMHNPNLLPQVIIIDGAGCPQKVKIFNSYTITRSNYEYEFRRIAIKIPDILQYTPRISKKEKAKELTF